MTIPEQIEITPKNISFTMPRFSIGDVVWCVDNKGHEMEGKIVSIVTHWSKKGEHYHIYSISKKGRKRLAHIGEQKIIYKYG